jgi:hypothetical protein
MDVQLEARPAILMALRSEEPVLLPAPPKVQLGANAGQISTAREMILKLFLKFSKFISLK